jgi:predicted nucleic acid-binding Zn ribbon protein
MPKQMKPQVKARYFCEQCGTEVRAGAAVCPSCGSVFTAVRCPECGYEGRAPEFHSGCPVCGYRARTKEQAPSESSRAAREKPGMSARFYRIVIAVLGGLIIGLVVLLLLRA